MKNREIIYLSRGLPISKIHNGSVYNSGIWKNKTEELIVKFDRIDGDDVANHVNHGGVDRVVCFYPFEHYSYWEKEFGNTLSVAAFGENMTGTNMREDQVCIGDIFQIGEAVLQVSQGRYPCATINKRNNNPLLLKRIFETGYTGYFFRVLQEGKITSQSEVKLVSAHPKKITVSSIHHLHFHHPSSNIEDIHEILELGELLAGPWGKLLQEKINK